MHGIALSTGCQSCSDQTDPTSGNRSGVALQAEVQRVQTQLADWQSCVSAKTPEGKAHIADLSRKLAAAKAQIARIEASSPAHKTVVVPANSSTTAAQSSHRGSIDVWA